MKRLSLILNLKQEVARKKIKCGENKNRETPPWQGVQSRKTNRSLTPPHKGGQTLVRITAGNRCLTLQEVEERKRSERER